MANNYPIRSCQHCNKSFQPEARNQPFCSLPCRFWSKVKILDSNECWVWQAHKNKAGYGRFRIVRRWKMDHRMAWTLTNGNIPNWLIVKVLHHCDNPPCCNPTHLFLGTQIDNMKDMVLKGRSPYNVGEHHPQSKLTEKDVIKIRESIINSTKVSDLAIKYNVSIPTIYAVKYKRNWSHI